MLKRDTSGFLIHKKWKQNKSWNPHENIIVFKYQSALNQLVFYNSPASHKMAFWKPYTENTK
jgi:hypothetical protein